MENTVDPDQLGFENKSADLELCCFKIGYSLVLKMKKSFVY